jgi:hypothetical protein
VRYKKSIPVLIQSHLQPEVETKQYACILAFTKGYATQDHFDTLLLTMNLLLVAGQTDKKRKYAVDFAFNTIKPALQNMKQRVYDTGKFGVNSIELDAIKKLIEFSREFWNRQPGTLYDFCVEQVNLFYKECEDKRNVSNS